MVAADRTSVHLVADEESSKRRRILDGACKVFRDLGFDGASMGEIARVAGVSKGTLYVYFADKCRLFKAIVEEEALERGQLAFYFDPACDIKTTLQRFGEAYIVHDLPAAWRIISPHGLRDRRAYAGNWPPLLRTCAAENRQPPRRISRWAR